MAFGVPWYVPDRFVKQHIRRNLQPEIAFPEDTRPILGPKPRPTYLQILRDRQPRRFPRGWNRMALADRQWRRTYALRWAASRKAAGLPSEITEPLYLKALEKTA